MSEENQNNDIIVVEGVANYSFVKESVNKIATMSWLFSFFYYMGWSYKQWKGIKNCNENYKNISPFWRGIFFVVFFSKLKKIIVAHYETKMNTLFQNENFPEEERKKWEKEYKQLKSPLAKLKVIQAAVNKIVPVGHPQGKTLTAGDFLGVPLLVFILLVLCGLSILSELAKGCLETEGKVLKNVCDDYAVTYPLNSEVLHLNNDNYDIYCQEDETESLCVAQGTLDDPARFDLEILAEDYNPVHKFTKQYAGNTTHCITEKDEENYYITTCFSKIEREDPVYIIFVRSSQKYSTDMANFEKLMNSYKNI